MNFRFVNDDCRRAGTCGCGFCKRMAFRNGKVVQDCERGDCRREAVTTCPIFGYPVCLKHETANGVRRDGRVVLGAAEVVPAAPVATVA